jgi:Fe2+ transport system protein FeoA
VRKSESGTQEWTLADAPFGGPMVVTRITAESPGALLVHGIRQGAGLIVEADAPFGGPRIMRIGRARVAVDRRLAGAVIVTAAEQRGAGDRE